MDRDNWIEILQVILRNPFRALLASIGVAWGIMMLILMVGAGNGLENGVKQNMAGMATNSMFMWTQSTSKAYKGFQPSRRFELNNSDVEYLKQNVPEIGVLSPRCQGGGYRGSNNVSHGTKTGAFNVYGDYPEYIQIEKVIITGGRYLNHADMDDKRKICVIGEEVRNVLFGEHTDPLGDYITINGVNFRVVGTFKPIKSGEDAMEDLQTIFIPFSTFQGVYHWGDTVGWLSMMSADGVSVQEMEDKVLQLLKVRKSVHPDDPRAFGHWNLQTEMDEMNLVFGAFDIVGFAIGLLVLFAGIIGIINIMLITVKERTNEFGIRRSLGASPRMVIIQVIKETLLLTSIAGLVGMMVGIGLLELLNYFLTDMESGSFSDPGVSLALVGKALIVMIFFGAVAGLLPAMRAVSIKPVDALRAQ